MKYIKNNYEGYIFDTELSQAFTNKPTTLVDEKNIIKLRSEKHISDSDMEIAKFLFNHRFATSKLLLQFLKRFNKTEEELRRDLSRLTKHRIVNSFALIDTSEFKNGVRPEIPHDALLIYCLDIGGRVLIGHFYNADTTEWYTTENMRSAEKVGKDLVKNNFLIQLMNDTNFFNNRDNYFKTDPVYSVNKTRVVPSFEMRIAVKNEFKYYVGDIVRKDEFPGFREHLFKLDSIMATNAWKKYFHEIEKHPTILFVCENDTHALEVAKMVVNGTSFNPSTDFRITTDERMKRGLGEKGAFLAYNDKLDMLSERSMAAFKENK